MKCEGHTPTESEGLLNLNEGSRFRDVSNQEVRLAKLSQDKLKYILMQLEVRAVLGAGGQRELSLVINLRQSISKG